MDKITLLYNTCDRYESLWKGFFDLWTKYWPGFNAPVILNSEKKTFSYEGLNISSPNHKERPTWSERLYAALKIVTTPYVLLTLDDFYIKSTVDTNEIQNCIDAMDNDKDIKLFTFGWQPGPNKPCSFSGRYEQRGRFAPYRVNAQIALWRTEYLVKIVKQYENPWEFELNGSFRSSIYGGKLYAQKKNAPLVFDYDWGFLIVRGQINREVADYFEKHEGIQFDTSFKDIDMDAYRSKGDDKSGRMLRKCKYLVKMILSLFRK